MRGSPFAPSHDAQSMAGILSTDVHGTGKIYGTEDEKWGFVSQSVVRLKLIDGRGQIHECEPSDDLFKAAIGGIGAVGIITEVVVQGVPRFNVEQKVEMQPISYVKTTLTNLYGTTTTSASICSPLWMSARSTHGTVRKKIAHLLDACWSP